MIRRDVVETLGCPDWPIALAEDLFTVISAVFAMHVVAS
jgi:hypothetical protein